MFATAEAGDTIITLEVPRLARSIQQLCEIIDTVREKRLRLVIVGRITLDCREGRAAPMCEAFLQMAGVFSQLELAIIRTRVRAGISNGKTKGRQIGRPQVRKEDIPTIFLRHYPAYKSKQLSFLYRYLAIVAHVLHVVSEIANCYVRNPLCCLRYYKHLKYF